MPDDPPSLQQLVLAYGTWDKIPAKAWQAFNAEMAEWKDKVRYGELDYVADRSPGASFRMMAGSYTSQAPKRTSGLASSS